MKQDFDIPDDEMSNFFSSTCNFSTHIVVITTVKGMKKVSFQNDVLPLKNQIYRLALRITLIPEEAEDIVQDTLLKLWSRRDDWDNIDNIEAYSLTICHNLALDRLKKRDSQNINFSSIPSPHGENEASITARQEHRDNTPADPLEQTLQRDRVRVVRQIIATLPEKQRVCIHLREFEEKTYKEIAAILNITEEQVKVNIFRARQTIKQTFNKIDNYGL